MEQLRCWTTVPAETGNEADLRHTSRPRRRLPGCVCRATPLRTGLVATSCRRGKLKRRAILSASKSSAHQSRRSPRSRDGGQADLRRSIRPFTEGARIIATLGSKPTGPIGFVSRALPCAIRHRRPRPVSQITARIAADARQAGVNRLVGEFIDSGRNQVASQFLANHGFTLIDDGQWERSLATPGPERPSWIQEGPRTPYPEGPREAVPR